MGRCEMCGNDYEKSFRVTTAEGRTYEFDCFECAIHAVAPGCTHCGCRVIGHGLERGGKMYCCEHCSRQPGASQEDTSSEDRVHAVEAGMNPTASSPGRDPVDRDSEQSFPASDPPSF